MSHVMGIVSQGWAAAIAAYGAYTKSGGAPETTRYARRQQLEHLARRIGTGPWEVTAAALLAYVSAQTWAPETRRSRRTTLRVFYAWAVEAGHVAQSPAAVLPRVRPTRPNPRPTGDVPYAMALATADARERLMLRLGAEHGLRRGEIAVVHSADLVEDLDGWTLIAHGKGGRDRPVPLLDDLAAALRLLPPGYAFPGRVEGHLSPRWVGRLLTRLLPEHTTGHGLRHRAATNWYEVERDLVVVQELLGHASPSTTRAYVAVDTKRMRATVKAA